MKHDGHLGEFFHNCTKVLQLSNIGKLVDDIVLMGEYKLHDIVLMGEYKLHYRVGDPITETK